jgi:hypothetical protein
LKCLHHSWLFCIFQAAIHTVHNECTKEAYKPYKHNVQHPSISTAIMSSGSLCHTWPPHVLNHCCFSAMCTTCAAPHPYNLQRRFAQQTSLVMTTVHLGHCSLPTCPYALAHNKLPMYYFTLQSHASTEQTPSLVNLNSLTV